ncbi:MAG: DUF2281 domain-containing protein [Rhizobacter sp.]|nr:DUF2281 domain-containing protein [Chlorobiales bacterium]
MSVQELLRTRIERLPEPEQHEVLNFVEFLLQRKTAATSEKLTDWKLKIGVRDERV